MADPFLSVVIPAYNEANNLHRGVLGQVAAYLSSQPYPSEVIVVDDGSQDETAALVEGFAASHAGFSLLRASHRGKARTVITGLKATRGQIALFSDMDQATPIDQVARILPRFEQGYDVVVGSRGSYRQNAPLWRKFMSRSQVFLRKLILDFDEIKDTQCGFKAFRHGAIAPILASLAIYGERGQGILQGPSVTSGFDVELLFAAKQLGYRICEVPVEWDYRRTRRVNLLRDAIRGVSELLQIWQANRRGLYRPKITQAPDSSK